jgi:hypothetical protein
LFVARGSDYKATVFVDGLQKALIRPFGSLLRRHAVRTEKIRGVRDETEPLIRLADAISGIVRAASEGRREFVVLLDKAKEDGLVHEL